MKYLKMFEDFKDSSSARADQLLKKIEKSVKYNLSYGSLHKNGYVFKNSDIYDDKGPYDWLKIELQSDHGKEYLYNVIFMMDEGFFGEEAKPGEEKIYVEIKKYKLPEYKQVASVKKNFPIADVFADDFITKQLEETDKLVLKVPKDQADYEKNVNAQVDSIKADQQPAEQPATTEQPEESQA